MLNRIWRWAVGGVVITGFVGLLSFAWIDARTSARLHLPQARTLLVPPGASVTTVGRSLAAEGVLSDAEDLRWAARLHGRGPIKAGEYALTPGLDVRGLLRLLESGDVILHALTIVPGSRFADLRRALAEHPAITGTAAGISDEELMTRLGAAGVHPEGQFLPDTYRFPRGTTDIAFLARAHQALQRELAAAWTARVPDLPLADPQQVLILASIIEKETALDAERETIAGVFTRRLTRGMRLQTDPTVIYGMGERYQGNITKRDLTTDTPYNTYTRAGLPPTPICLPDAASIRAAVRPEAGDALYFVATGDGGHAFSATLEEHNAAVRRYLRLLRERRAAEAR